MKQIIQDLRSGKTLLEEVPVPMVRPGHILVRTTRSLVSLGTERMLVEFGKAGLIEKARQQPEKVKQVLDKIRSDGLLPTLEAVFNKLNQPLPLGYCNVGIVEEVGKGVTAFKKGDRVASNGNHACFVLVPENLAAHIPAGVSDDEAAFTVIGAIALQGVRLLNPTLGETIVVTGLGLIGLLTAGLLGANGCRVIGIEPDERKAALAGEMGIRVINPAAGENVVGTVMELTGNTGADGVIITASSKSDELIHEAAEMSRKRGRIVLTGVIGLNLRRSDFYQKELTFQVSCSYGPGRYDENYEAKGQDYPIGFVRWTEKRNFEAVLEAIASGRLKVLPMITDRLPLEEYSKVYDSIGQSKSIAVILNYPESVDLKRTVTIGNGIPPVGSVSCGIIGAGNFTSSTIIPSLRKAGIHIRTIASARGLTAGIMARKAGAAKATTDYHDILGDSAINLVIISTRHNLHGQMVAEALRAGKHVFVEKPLCLNETELTNILATLCELENEGAPLLSVGFNRRFAPLAIKMKSMLGSGPFNITATMNAGFIPGEVWVHDPETGGGRIIGEACHLVDLCTYLTGSLVTDVCMNALGPDPTEITDNASMLLRYADGSNVVINYLSNGSKAYPKERVEVHSRQRTLIMDNWRSLEAYGFGRFSNARSRQDKGHRDQFRLLGERLVSGGPSPISLPEIVNTTRVTFAAIESLRENRWVKVSEELRMLNNE